jgi:hypothetical protein
VEVVNSGHGLAADANHDVALAQTGSLGWAVGLD